MFKVSIITFVCTLLLTSHTLLAQQRSLKVEHKEALDVVILLDASGSMFLTDPLRLRDEGSKLFIELLKKGDRVALVEFSREAHVIRQLHDYTPEQSALINEQLKKIENRGEYTDLYAAIVRGAEIIRQSGREDANRVIILLSDGKMEPDPKISDPISRQAQLETVLLPLLKEQGIKIYTLAFSELADRKVLDDIAKATDGLHWFTPTADKIHESFADLFLSVKKPQVIPASAKGFKIDAGVTEATFYINRENSTAVSLITPNGDEITSASRVPGIRWFLGTKFDVVTVEKPEIGQWHLVGLASNDGFATLLTDLKLITDWPNSIDAETPTVLQARLYETDKPVALPEVSGVTRFAVQITPTDKVSEPIIREFLKDDGKDGDEIADDGIFSLKVEIKEPGEYRLRVVAQSPTFERSQQVVFRVKPPMVGLKVVKEVGQTEQKVEEEFFQIEISEEATPLKDLQLRLEAVDAERKKYVIPTERLAGETFRASVLLLPKEGSYRVKATITGQDRKKKEIKSSSKEIRYNKVKVDLGSDQVLEIVAVAEEQVEKKVEQKPEPFLIPLIIVILGSGGLAAAAFITYKKALASSGPEVPDFVLPKDIEQGLAQLEAKSQATEVNIEDTMYLSKPAPLAAVAEAQTGTEDKQEAGTAES